MKMAKWWRKIGLSTIVPKERCPFDVEFIKYIEIMIDLRRQNRIDGETDPLKFWADMQDHLPILARMARRALATPACSTDAERLFSHSGDVPSNS